MLTQLYELTTSKGVAQSMGTKFVGMSSRVLYSIGALVVMGLIGVIGAPVFAQDDTALPSKPVTIQVVEAPVKVVLDQLFKSVGLNYTIDQAVTGNVTVNLTNIPFNSALHVILQSANPPLTFTYADQVYTIKPKIAAADLTNPGGPAAPAAPAAPTDTTQTAGSDSTDTTALKQVKRIQLNYVDGPSLMMYVLGGGSVLPSLTNQLGSSGGGGFGGNSNGNSSSGFGGSSGGFGSSSGGFGGSSGGFGGSSGGFGGSSGGFGGGF